MSTLPPPKLNISPLIRFARWTALISGIIYGAYKYNYLSAREIGIQKYENEIRERHRIKMAAEKKQREADEMDDLAKDGIVLK